MTRTLYKIIVNMLLGLVLNSSVAAFSADVDPIGQLIAANNNASASAVFGARTLFVASNAEQANLINIWGAPGVQFDEFLNVPAFSNAFGGRYQCTELVHRFLSRSYGIPTQIGMGLGNANMLLRNLVNRFGQNDFNFQGTAVRMRFLKNAFASEPPAVGGVINFNIGPKGHVAVVRYIEIVSDKIVKVYLFEQHGLSHIRMGQALPVRFIVVNKKANGLWAASAKPGIGSTISWINFQTLY